MHITGIKLESAGHINYGYILSQCFRRFATTSYMFGGQ